MSPIVPYLSRFFTHNWQKCARLAHKLHKKYIFSCTELNIVVTLQQLKVC